MINVSPTQNIIRQVGLFAGSIILLFGMSACDGIIEIVPISTPVSNSVPATPETAANSGPASGGHSPTHITAEVIGLDAPVVEMGWQVVEHNGELISEWQMPDNEAAWHGNSARPGEGSNIVISGHNESAGGQVFADIEELQVGDEITLRNDNEETFVYQVIEKNIIRTFAGSAEAQNYLRAVVEPTDSEQLTLITCWPRWTNTHRLVVIAEPKPIAASLR